MTVHDLSNLVLIVLYLLFLERVLRIVSEQFPGKAWAPERITLKGCACLALAGLCTMVIVLYSAGLDYFMLAINIGIAGLIYSFAHANDRSYAVRDDDRYVIIEVNSISRDHGISEYHRFFIKRASPKILKYLRQKQKQNKPLYLSWGRMEGPVIDRPIRAIFNEENPDILLVVEAPYYGH